MQYAGRGIKKNKKFFNFKNTDVIREAKFKLGLQE
jgi:hypothetical protein